MTEPASFADRLRRGAGRVYYSLPQGVVDVLGRAHPLVALAEDRSVPLVIARGQGAGTSAPASVLVAGSTADAGYFLSRFFSGAIEMESRGEVSLAELPTALRRLRESCDLTIARLDRIASRFLLGAEYARLPDWLDTIAPVPVDIERFTSQRRTLRSDVTRVRGNDLRWSISRAPADFDHFYQTMYLPFAQERHGHLAIGRNEHQLRRVFRAGCLLWVTHRGERIAAILLMPEDRVLKFVALGTRDGALAPVSLGGLAALYLFSVEYAAEMGLSAVDFGGVRPCLSDGVLRFKLKWGVRLRPKGDVYHDLLLYWPRLGRDVASFLNANPLVCRRGASLFGLGFGQPRPRAVTGLERICVLGEADRDHSSGAILSRI